MGKGIWDRIFNCQLNFLEKVRDDIHKKVGPAIEKKDGETRR